ncbi:hypothetical protein J437_LFUL018959 [Ladona fulva]|uniref:Phosphatidylinositol-3,4,5-trisphosphate 3-phosphatase n=1 Tax=Ladona fulva TaxID=123851 RepID=A0A8K0KB77_LADFU|nr:hypothetical protein J437_LFUL018959 [Ladona fulva]
MPKYRKMQDEDALSKDEQSFSNDQGPFKEEENHVDHATQNETLHNATLFFWNTEDYIFTSAEKLEIETDIPNRQLRRVVEGLPFRIITNIIILTDIIFAIMDVAGSLKDRSHKGDHVPLRNVVFTTLDIMFSCYFLIEIGLRIYAVGWKDFVSSCYNILDASVVAITFVISLVDVIIESSDIHPFKLLLFLRLVRTFRMARLITEKKNLEKGLRQAVSRNKRRYQRDGFDLDLTYVTSRIIAMSFPSSGLMSLYRNPIKEVVRFLDLKHPDHYKVYNLCSERDYEASRFHGRVKRYHIDDHNVPSLEQMLDFKDSVKNWLDEDPLNVIVVHCKGGKGRTGTMVCVWLISAGLLPSADECLTYFGDRRTDLEVGNMFQGVETPSQSRYVRYFEKTLKLYGGKLPPKKFLVIRKVKIYHLAGVGKGDGSDFSVEISLGRNNVVFSANFGMLRNCHVLFINGVLEVTLLNCPTLCDDVRLLFPCSSRRVPKGYEKVPFYLWFHTSFIENYRLFLSREELDNPHKSKTWKVFQNDFAVEIIFSDAER